MGHNGLLPKRRDVWFGIDHHDTLVGDKEHHVLEVVVYELGVLRDFVVVVSTLRQLRMNVVARAVEGLGFFVVEGLLRRRSRRPKNDGCGSCCEKVSNHFLLHW